MRWRSNRLPTPLFVGFSCGSAGKESAYNVGDLGSIPGLDRSPGERKGYPLQYSYLENSMDCRVPGVTKSWTLLNDFHFMLCLIFFVSLFKIWYFILNPFYFFISFGLPLPLPSLPSLMFLFRLYLLYVFVFIFPLISFHIWNDFFSFNSDSFLSSLLLLCTYSSDFCSFMSCTIFLIYFNYFEIEYYSFDYFVAMFFWYDFIVCRNISLNLILVFVVVTSYWILL